ncbi:MAG TPA: aminoacyl-tRNA hydrolase [Patescibacteria group bacterium]|nr:aminoacyl-tRNA hydrolase [Patescibacteria group bacterium]
MGKIYLVGLGNPGKKFERTRHNSGFRFLDLLAQKFDVQWKHDSSLQAEIAAMPENGLVLMKPQTFMNKSGEAVRGLVKYGGQYDRLYIAYDDLDLALGVYKIQFDKGPKIHNGVNSIRETLGDIPFWNIRIGTDTRNGDRSMPSEEYVLQPFTELEEHKFLTTVEKIVQEMYASVIPS